ncbi:MAG: HlyD family efflux transporter periplasmic adaptor subunit [Culicoidibacterales bacterium]
MKMYNQNELRNSRIFFDKQPPNFMKYFLFFIVTLMITSLLLSLVIPKTYIVQAAGTIEADDKSYITPMINGTVVSIEKQEGELVKAGDIIIRLTSTLGGVESREIDKQINHQNERINLLNLYKQSLDQQQNLLTNEGIEQEFYGKIAYYLDQRKSERIQIAQDGQKLEDKQIMAQRLTAEIAALAKGQADLAKTEQKAKADQLETLTAEIKDLENAQAARSSQAEGMYNQLISELGTVRAQVESKISELQSQKSLKNKEESNLELKAEQTGKLHYLGLIKPGVALQGFQPVAHIDEGEQAKLIVESYIPAHEISKIKIGNTVNIGLQGVNQTKFGTLVGTIKTISNGTITQQVGEESRTFYQVTIAFDGDRLTSKKGEEIKIMPSFQVSARIIYNSESYFEWLLEQLNFVNK